MISLEGYNITVSNCYFLPHIIIIIIMVYIHFPIGRFAIFNGLRREQCFVTFDSDHLTIPSPLAFPPSSYHIYYSPNSTQGMNYSHLNYVISTDLFIHACIHILYIYIYILYTVL